MGRFPLRGEASGERWTLENISNRKLPAEISLRQLQQTQPDYLLWFSSKIFAPKHNTDVMVTNDVRKKNVHELIPIS